jgi:hypothetical protein
MLSGAVVKARCRANSVLSVASFSTRLARLEWVSTFVINLTPSVRIRPRKLKLHDVLQGLSTGVTVCGTRGSALITQITIRCWPCPATLHPKRSNIYKWYRNAICTQIRRL